VAAAHLCREDGAPCLTFNSCRKVREGIHPDVITVQDTEHKELTVEAVRQLKQDVYVQPNEGQRKVYLFADCQQLNERDQNVLLKIVEEGPPYAAFLFCASSAHGLLPTVRSRCVELKLRGDEGAADLTEAAALCRAIAGKKATGLAEYLCALENRRIKREELRPLLQGAWQIAAEALLQRRGKVPDDALAPYTDALSPLNDTALRRTEDVLRRMAAECETNVGPGHVLGALLSHIQQEVYRR
ncbi:MAG: DNA polymerase III subunit delta', partial [Oscillospiraceae bacterium]|nr:DNA polymerase III subunit delta' [Oscillospiraceae bacterium]